MRPKDDHPKSALRLNHHGMGIVMVMVMASVLTLGVYMFTSSITLRTKSSQGFKQTQGRDLLSIQVENMSKDPLTVLQSLNSANPSLANCVLNDTVVCQMGAWSKFELYRTNLMVTPQVVESDPIAPVVLRAPAAGLNSLSGFYSNSGSPCSKITEATRACPFQVTARFCATDRAVNDVKNLPQCQCQATPCPSVDQATSILFELRVAKVFDSKAEGDVQVQLKEKIINQVFSPTEILSAAQ